MKKPAYQSVTENAVIVLFSIGAVASIIKAVVDATGLIGYMTGLVLFSIINLLWIVLTYLAEKGKIKWTLKGGHIVRPKKLSLKTDLYFCGVLLILSIHIGYDFYKNGPFSNKDQPLAPKIVFDPKDSYFKLLILPWQKECTIEGKSYDIGLVMKNRLQDMVTRDSLGLHVYYLADSADYKNFTKDSFNTLMKFHNADMIIHGYYSFKECENGNSDKVCYMYQADLKKAGIEVVNEGKEYAMHDMHGLEDIREGAGQESIDFIIHWVAAMSEFSRKNFSKAIRIFENIKDYEKNQDILFQISNCYYYMNDNEHFREMLGKVLKINPHHEEASIHMSMLLIKDGKIAAAKECLKEVSATNSRDINVLRDLCMIYRSLGDTVRSEAYFNRVVAEVPEGNSTFKMLGALYKDVNKYSKSKEYYEKAFKVCSKHADDWNVMGCAYLLLGDTMKAKPYFSVALEKNENSVMALYNMGILLYREKKYNIADEYLHRAESIGPLSGNILIALGNNHEALGEKERAITYFKKTLALDPYTLTALVKIAVLNMQLKRNEEANKYLDQLINYYPHDAGLLNSMGYLCAREGNYSQAEIYYRRLLKFTHGNGAVLYNLASMSAYQQKEEQAMKFLSQALAAMPVLKKTAKTDKAFDCIRADNKFSAITE